MIGGLLRFAPGRLGARQDRAPAGCVIGRWVGSRLPCRASHVELDTRGPHMAGPVWSSRAGMATGGAYARDASAMAG